MITSTFAIIIVNYNSGELIKDCISSVLRQRYSPKRVVVVDNASTDASISHLREINKKGEVELIELNMNTGFAAANNAAVNIISDCDYLALLNPDAIADTCWLENVNKAINAYTEYACFASCMLDYNEPDLIDGMGDAYNINGKAWPINKGRKLSTVNNADCEVFAPCAGAAIYRADAFRTVNGFDERYFCYHEDVDLGFRLRLAGYKTMYIKDAIVHHLGSAISGKGSDFSIYHAHRNIVWTYFKNMPTRLLFFSLPSHLLLNGITILYFLIVRRKAVIVKSKLHALLGLPSILKSRRIIQRNKKIADIDLLSLLRAGDIQRKLVSLFL